MARREVAWRVFAGEFNDADLSYQEEGDRSPNYVVTPLGARANRVFLVGVLTSTENVGTTEDFWRGQVTDPTGVFHVYAGQYDPEAAAKLSELTPPTVVAVVGKARTYSPEEGTTYTSVRPEVIKEVDVSERNRWVLEAAKHTRKRLEAMNQAMEMEEATVDALVRAGFDEAHAEGVVRALEHYGPPAMERYVALVEDALETLLPGSTELRTDFAPAKEWEQEDEAATEDSPGGADGTEADSVGSEVDQADQVLELVEELETDEGAPWEEIVSSAAEQDITEEQVEEALNDLMDRGLVYEPVLGRLKTT